MKIYIDPQTPGAADVAQTELVKVAEWTSIRRTKEPFIWIRHNSYRDLSRWTHTERKRPFMVGMRGRHELSAHKTLEAAVKAATKYVKQNT